VSDPTGILPSSFRDPRGFVFRAEGVLLRQVNPSHQVDYDEMLASGLYEDLVAGGILVPHDEVDVALSPAPGAYRVLRPDVVPFLSYPYEWSFAAFRDAALLTLRAQERAMAHGMSLRDASAYNVQFMRGAPILIDSLSFEVLPADRPWVAYRQFCEHFLGPLALMSMRDVRMGRGLSAFLEGLPLDLVSALLPARTRARPGLQMHIRMHAGSQRRHAGGSKPRSSRTFSRRAFEGLISSLHDAVTSLKAPAGDSAWDTYYDEADHYPSGSASKKETVVASWIDEVTPRSVWDLGANTGRFAWLAAERGIPTVAFDVDPFVVDAMYHRSRADRTEHVLPLVMDLTNPSPAIGWGHRERLSLQERAPADLVLALALIHHLAIGANVPLGMIVDVLAAFGRTVILEWVPKSDPKVQVLLRSREDVFDAYDERSLMQELERRFVVRRREMLEGTDRILLLLERR
jgi:hypothetical protein